MSIFRNPVSFRFMAGCRQWVADEDRYERFLRMARAAHFAGYLLALGLIIDSAQELLESGEPFNKSAMRILFFYALTLVLMLSWEGDTSFLDRTASPHRMLLPVACLWLGAETAPHFTEWDTEAVLGWWRTSLLIAMASSGLAWISERWVRSLRARSARNTAYGE